MLNMEYDVQQEEFLNDTLVMAGFDPTEDDFDMLKEDMRPILNESIDNNFGRVKDDMSILVCKLTQKW